MTQDYRSQYDVAAAKQRLMREASRTQIRPWTQEERDYAITVAARGAVNAEDRKSSPFGQGEGGSPETWHAADGSESPQPWCACPPCAASR